MTYPYTHEYYWYFVLISSWLYVAHDFVHTHELTVVYSLMCTFLWQTHDICGYIIVNPCIPIPFPLLPLTFAHLSTSFNYDFEWVSHFIPRPIERFLRIIELFHWRHNFHYIPSPFPIVTQLCSGCTPLQTHDVPIQYPFNTQWLINQSPDPIIFTYYCQNYICIILILNFSNLNF